MTISQRIFEIMEEKHLKQSDLANYLGISNSSVSDWKKKGSIPSADKIIKISEFLNVSVMYLLGEPEKTVSNTLNTSDDNNENRIQSTIKNNSISQRDMELLENINKLNFNDYAEIINYINSKIKAV